MKVDVVIPTRNEPTLSRCIKAVRENIDVNRIILVSDRENPLGDLNIILEKGNVGEARALGLQAVNTPIFASVDSDVLVTPEWWAWAKETIMDPQNGAVQGYAAPEGNRYRTIQTNFIKRGGQFGRGFCCLGNVLLKTDIVRKVGMPTIRVGEDWELRNRIEAIGYRWVSNFDIWVPHLKSDRDVLHHSIWWGKMGGNVNYWKSLKNGLYFFVEGTLTLNQNHLWHSLNQFCMIYGGLAGTVAKIKSEH